MSKKNSIVLPGEILTTEEEYLPGENTFEEKGNVKSKISGRVIFDDEKREVKVKGKNVEMLKKGDVVFAKVNIVKTSMVVVEIVDSEGNKAIGLSSGQIPVRFVSNAFVKDLGTCFKVGDLVKAKVVSANEIAVDLCTNQTGLGVVTAYCSKCRKRMTFNNGKLRCMDPECGSIEERKWAETEDLPTERGTGGGFGDRGRSFGSRDSGRRFSGERKSFGGTGKDFGNKGRSFGHSNGKSFNPRGGRGFSQRGGFRR